MDYFHCSRFLFFKTAGDFLYLCNIHRIVEDSREPCTPRSQSLRNEQILDRNDTASEAKRE
ncbi:hypothetical protein T12_9611 [Trichinella patagoniensis]|uniref:Uncharacterized protein n=1 Tax=Trichinella patagoniensis TaxID=990121 RepID=A0A0V0YWP7_9BILA|nr:hypothetical protein T12_1681 [Trichinella patagoniensis]KRY05192.1 hypothetical protein T12_9611 [Trichinella patagoniensis]